MPFGNKYRPSRVNQIEQKAEKNGFVSFFLDPQQDYFYKGSWKGNKKSGHGHKIFGKEKFCYEGYFDNDLFHGFGRLGKSLPDGTTEVIYEGYWANGKMEGPGRWVISKNKKERSCQPPRPLEFSEMKTDPSSVRGESFETLLENDNNTGEADSAKSCVYDLINRELNEKLRNPRNYSDLDFFWNIVKENTGDHLAINDGYISCCCSGEAEESCWNLTDFLGSKSERSTETSSEISESQSSHQKNLLKAPSTIDPSKPKLETNNGYISFQQLKEIYKEFQNLTREEKKNDTWDEFVNEAQFQVRPDPGQDRVDYVQPNFTDFRTDCQRGIFYRNANGDKLSIHGDENMHDVLRVADKLELRKTLGLKAIDETMLKFYLYDGIMKNNLPDGFGFACFPDDIYYYGKWKCGKFHGTGILMSLNEYSYEGHFENGERLGHGVYINYQNGYVQRGFWAKGSFIESTVEISYRRQSAVYPVIFPIPDLKICDDTAVEGTSWNCEDFMCHDNNI